MSKRRKNQDREQLSERASEASDEIPSEEEEQSAYKMLQNSTKNIDPN